VEHNLLKWLEEVFLEVEASELLLDQEFIGKLAQ